VEGPAGVRLIRTRQPTRRPVTVQGLPCTDAIRTLVDCAAQLKAIQVDAMVDAALAKRLISVNQLIEAVEAGGYHFTPGRKHLGERMAARGVTGSPHPSVLESHMSRLIQGFGLPFPRAEVHWGPDRRYRLDFAYPELKLAIEVDGLIAHFSPEQQRYDLRRRNALVRQGWTVLYYTWRDVLEEPDRVAAEIAGEYRRLHAA
jgi:hypothetical protein